MKLANKKCLSVNGLFNNQQNVIIKGRVNNYVKAIVLVVTLSVSALFSKDIQNTLISNYNKSVAFVQKHNTGVILPLGV
ncbi:hypothetical protein [Lacinutrix jangbogonensis]|uniref:hypothetical protein n=1 Tax=Lacinutrix jangbogonensis TaxID=1469557 RepID=UPI00053F19DB|nr:hypothetical protein [Lacinutrix jangbogonensis]